MPIKQPLTAKRRPVVTSVSVKVHLSNGVWVEWDGRWTTSWGNVRDFIDGTKIAEAHDMIKNKLIEEAVL